MDHFETADPSQVLVRPKPTRYVGQRVEKRLQCRHCLAVDKPVVYY